MILHALWDFGSFSWAGAFAATGVGPNALIESTTWAGLLTAAGLPLQAALIILCLVAAKRVFSTPIEMAD